MSAGDVRMMRHYRAAYAEQRAAEGRAYSRDEMLMLPDMTRAPLARQWSVRRRTYEEFMRRVMSPLVAASQTPLQVLDLGAGNAWLSYRLALAGCAALAMDLRDDCVDGLGAAEAFIALAPTRISRAVASFDCIPLADHGADVVVFNASLHYAVDLTKTLREARRVVKASGRIVILDSPFYENVADGDAMVREKRSSGAALFGMNADVLLSIPCIEFLTPSGLADASAPLGIRWTRHRVRYPLWYETRALRARMRGRRTPSRFDLWEGTIA
jgi:SAM-dependent methyltransferase